MLGELNGIVNPTLREWIDKSIVGKLINAKVNANSEIWAADLIDMQAF